MKSIIQAFFLVSSFWAYAQVELISQGPIPLGIKVFDSETKKHLDILDLCEGLDEEGLPKNLVLPENSQIVLFLPTVKASNGGQYLASRQGEKPNVLSNVNYDYNGKKVALLLKGDYGGGYSNRIDVSYYPKADFERAPKHTLQFEWYRDTNPFTLHLFLQNDEVDERGVYIDSVMSAMAVGEETVTKSYTYWLEKGYTNELSESGRPLFPVLPVNVGDLSFLTNSPEVSITRDGKPFEPMKTERGIGSEIIYYLSTELPGTYVINLHDPEIKYGRSGLYFTYTIKGSIWDEGGYYFLAIILIILTGFLIYRVNAKRKLKRSEMGHALLAAELKAVRSQLNPHFLFNALNAIQNLVNQDQKDKANDYIAKLSSLLRRVLAQSKESFHTLEEELELSGLYLELEKLRKPFKFELGMDKSLDQNILVPSMILQPYLENAIVHGVHQHSADMVQLRVSSKDGMLLFTVQDNGKHENSTYSEGQGLYMGRKRLELLDQQMKGKAKPYVQTNMSGSEFMVEICMPIDL